VVPTEDESVDAEDNIELVCEDSAESRFRSLSRNGDIIQINWEIFSQGEPGNSPENAVQKGEKRQGSKNNNKCDKTIDGDISAGRWLEFDLLPILSGTSMSIVVVVVEVLSPTCARLELQ